MPGPGPGRGPARPRRVMAAASWPRRAGPSPSRNLKASPSLTRSPNGNASVGSTQLEGDFGGRKGLAVFQTRRVKSGPGEAMAVQPQACINLKCCGRGQANEAWPGPGRRRLSYVRPQARDRDSEANEVG